MLAGHRRSPERRAGRKQVIMDEYKCDVCGYIYNPKAGDPDGGVPTETGFDELPDDWVCPDCGVGKSQFKKI